MPHFTIKNNFQKRAELYEDILTEEILRDVCRRITGDEAYTVNFDNSGYNIGRLAILEHEGSINYISFSEVSIASRNSSFQSFPSALIKYQLEQNPNKNLFFYFLVSDGRSSIQTPYFLFMYRLMVTVGTYFLNAQEHLANEIIPFNSVDDLIANRSNNRVRNSGNNSSYITINENNVLQVYGKTYGANKYETTLLCIAISKITTAKIELYQIEEGDLVELPLIARRVIQNLGIEIITSDLTLERREFEENNSLRSPTYIYNLLEKLGSKRCAMCQCEIPQIIQGAHIWPVASIKRAENITQDIKLESAIDGDNGIWLCSNHHKLFDINLLLIARDGRVMAITNLKEIDENYLNDVTLTNQIPENILTQRFLGYLEKRNSLIDEALYSHVN